MKENISTEDELEQSINLKQLEISEFCKNHGTRDIIFFSFEALLVGHIARLACLYIQLFVLARHNSLRYESWLEEGLYYFII